MPALRAWRRGLARLPGLAPAWRFVRRLADADYRAVQRLLSHPGERTLQPWPTTAEDRYPVLFDEVARRLRDIQHPRILSFGCASGEEVRALERRLPHADIMGIDINPRAIAKARKAGRGGRSRFVVGDAPPADETFDAILALAVFRHGRLEQRPPLCSAFLPFRRFEEGLARLDAALRPGGLLAIANAHFRLADTHLAPSYAAELRRADDPPPQTPLYGPDDRLLAGASEDAVLFRKL